MQRVCFLFAVFFLALASAVLIVATYSASPFHLFALVPDALGFGCAIIGCVYVPGSRGTVREMRLARARGATYYVDAPMSTARNRQARDRAADVWL